MMRIMGLAAAGGITVGTTRFGRASTLMAMRARACGHLLDRDAETAAVEGQDVLAFVHPLVRSAVYQDMAPPIRQRLHEQAARMLAAQRQPLQDVAVHLLESGPGADAWAAGMLRQAAADAYQRGAPGVATRYLERALAGVPGPEARAEVLQELGSIEVGHAPARAAEHLTDALAATITTARRAAIALPLGHALAQAGRFAQSVDVPTRGIAELGHSDPQLRAELETVLIDTARWDPASHTAADTLLRDLQARSDRGEQLAALLHAGLATHLTSVLLDRPRALRHAREALPATTGMLEFNTPIVPETISVFLFADCLDEARQAAHSWLTLAQSRGLPLASSVAASFASLVALHAGAVSESAAWARQAR